MTDKPRSGAKETVAPAKQGEGGPAAPAEGQATAKRGRSAKEPPPPKIWRIEGVSPEGLKVTLGRYATKEEAEPELDRLSQDDFYNKLKIIKSPIITEPS